MLPTPGMQAGQLQSKHSHPTLTQVGATIRPNTFSFGPASGHLLLVCRLPGGLFLHFFISVQESLPQKVLPDQQIYPNSDPSPTLSPSLLYSSFQNLILSVFLLCNYLFVLFLFCNVGSLRTDFVKLTVASPRAQGTWSMIRAWEVLWNKWTHVSTVQ